MVVRTLVATSAAAAALGVLCAVRRPAKPVDPKRITETGGKWIRRPDGRILEYCVIGDPAAAIVIYAASGYGSSAHYWDLGIVKEWCKKNNARLITVSMPGCGLSEGYPVGVKRSLLDWGSDVLAIMNQEHVEQFYLHGSSTGCMHACAVAVAAPNRCLGMVLCTPTAPASIEKATVGISPVTVFMKSALILPYIGDLMAYALVNFTDAQGRFRAVPDYRAAGLKMESMGGAYAETVRQIIADSEHCQTHTYRCYCDTMHIIMDDPPFDLGDLAALTQRGVRIGIVTAADDTTNPPAMHEWFHKQIEGSALLQVEPGWGHAHFIVPGICERTFDYLITGQF